MSNVGVTVPAIEKSSPRCPRLAVSFRPVVSPSAANPPLGPSGRSQINLPLPAYLRNYLKLLISGNFRFLLSRPPPTLPHRAMRRKRMFPFPFKSLRNGRFADRGGTEPAEPSGGCCLSGLCPSGSARISSTYPPMEETGVCRPSLLLFLLVLLIVVFICVSAVLLYLNCKYPKYPDRIFRCRKL